MTRSPIRRSVPQSSAIDGLQTLQNNGIPSSIFTTTKSGVAPLNDSRASFFGLKNEWDGSVPSAIETTTTTTWEVQLDDLEQVPAFYPLEKTHREVSEDPSIIASRISEALQVLSIQTEFCNKTSKAKCHTNDFVTFRIRLYAGSQSGIPVVVEIQRRSGSPKSFMRTCRVLLDAASYGTIPSRKSEAIANRSHTVEHHSVMQMLSPVIGLKCLEKALVADQEASHTVTTELESIIDLFNGELQHEQEILALENLLCLTDALKSSPRTAIQASEAVFSNCHLREIVLDQAIGSTPRQHHDVLGTGNGVGNMAVRKRQLALAVFANALESKASSLTEGVLVNWLSVNLVPVIVEALQEAPQAACVAYQASRCASQLASQSAVLRLELECHRTVLEVAYGYGQKRHELLRDGLKLCLELLNNH